MPFLLNLVSCFGPVRRLAAPPATSSTEEAWRLGQMPCNGKKCCSGASKKVGGRKALPLVQWRPSLCTISEDDTVKLVEKAEDTVVAFNKQMRCTGSKSNSQMFKYKSDDALRQRASFETSIPTFFPAVFFF